MRYLLISFIFLLTTCQQKQERYSLNLPPGFPEPEIPADNQLTVARVALGKQLFYDPILSRDSSISCASCHLPAMAFADAAPISPGVEDRLGLRNAPSLANLAYLTKINKDGGVAKLDMQAATPIEDENEMDLPITAAIERLKEKEIYPELFQKAYNQPPNPFTLTRALAAFGRTLISGNSPYDQFHFQKKSARLSESARRGMRLFNSERTNCSNCHSGFNFTNNSFENNGLFETFKDKGRARITLQPEDEGKFRVPSLRNVELTPPYMHNGSVTTLERVIDHYNSGGKEHPNKSPLIRPLHLSEQERKDLVNFLKSLTDSTFVNNPDFLR